jgi:transposase
VQAVSTIGLDIAKSVFQVHGVDAHGKVVVRRQLKRRYVLPFFKKLSPCLVGIEACATSHHWWRELQAAVSGSGVFSRTSATSIISSVRRANGTGLRRRPRRDEVRCPALAAQLVCARASAACFL